MTEARRRHVLWVAMVAAVVVAAVLSALAVLAATAAADLDGSEYRSERSRGGHHSVAVAVPPLVPGDSSTWCVEVAAPDVAGVVRVHGTSSGGLVDHLTFVVERGSGSCARPGPLAVVYHGSLGRLGHDYASGHDAEAGVGAERPTPYLLTVRLDDDAPSSAQGDRASLAVTWEVKAAGPTG